MATLIVSYIPATGRTFIDLTSWAGDAGFAATPVAGDQIEHLDTLTVASDGVVSGAGGTYTLRHIAAATGSTESISYSFTSADVTAPVLTSPSATAQGQTQIEGTVTTDEGNGILYTLASANAVEAEATVKAGGVSQAVEATGVQTVTVFGLTAGESYYLHFMHEDAETNQSTVVSSGQVTTALEPNAATITVPYGVDGIHTLAVLEEGFDPYAFQQWPANEPAAGWQLVTVTADGYFDSQGNYWFDEGAPGTHTVWVIDLTGTVYVETVDNTGLILPLTGEMSFGQPTVGRNSASLPFSYSAADADGYEYRVDNGPWITVVSPISLSDLTSSTTHTVDARAFNATTQSVWATLTFTTSAAVDTTPAALSFVAQTDVARGVKVTSNAIIVQDVDAGVDVPISVAGDPGSEYSVSDDGGATYGDWTSADTTVRLNYRVRTRHDSSPEYSSGGYDGDRETQLTIGGVTGTFRSTTLADTTPPVITLTSGNVTVVQGEPWVEPGYSAVDVADGNITVTGVQITGAINTGQLGEQSLTYTATDRSGNSSSATRLVTVVEAVPEDTTRPVISLDGGNVTLAVGDPWVEPGYEATDNVDGVITDRVQITGVVNTAQAGTYTVTYTVSDLASNIRSVTRTVYVVASVSMTVLAPSYRTVIPEFTAQGGVAAEIFFKAPRETLDFDIDLTDWVAGETDTIDAGLANLLVETDVSGLNIMTHDYIPSEDRIKIWLEGGTDGASYTVSAFITTISGRRKKFIFRIATGAFW